MPHSEAISIDPGYVVDCEESGLRDCQMV
jgi:hypothetical protein